MRVSITAVNMWKDIVAAQQFWLYCAPFCIKSDWLSYLPSVNNQTCFQIFVQYSHKTHNLKVQSKGSCGSNKYPWSLSRPHRSPVWGGWRLSFLLDLNPPLFCSYWNVYNFTAGNNVEFKSLRLVRTTAARTLNNDWILEHAHSIYPQSFID